jgi:hypothetical protein
MAKRGRPHGTFGITRYQVRVLSEQFRQGATIKAACEAAKISTNAYYRYIKAAPDAPENTIMGYFREQVFPAQEEAEERRRIEHQKKFREYLKWKYRNRPDKYEWVINSLNGIST